MTIEQSNETSAALAGSPVGSARGTLAGVPTGREARVVVPDVGAPAPATSLVDVVTVVHQGTVIAFARARESTDVYYNVLDVQVDVQSEELEWTGFSRLSFPPGLRAAGMGLVTIDDDDGSVVAAHAVPLRVVSDDRYICMFRKAAQRNTLLMNRFMLKRVPSVPGAPAVPVVEPIWEVRFQRSGKRDVPDGDRDTQSYQSPDGTPFLEPTLDLWMIGGISRGWFDVLALPSETGSPGRWQIFAAGAGKLDLYSFPMDEDGLMDFGAVAPPEAGGAIGRDVSIELTLAQAPENVALLPAGAPAAAIYALRERTSASGGDDVLVKRTTRVMVAMPVRAAAPAGAVQDDGAGLSVATLDFALAKDGTLAGITPQTTLGEVTAAPNGLQFVDGASLELSKRLVLAGSFSAQLWLCPASAPDRDRYVFGGEDGAPYLKAMPDMTLEFGFGTGAGAVSVRTSRPVLQPGAWAYARVVYDAANAASPFAIEINERAREIVATGNPTMPADAAITTIGTDAPRDCPGIDATLALLEIRDGHAEPARAPADWTVVGEWPMAAVDYELDPPTTPDGSDRGNDAVVRGAMLVALTAPIDNASDSGLLQVDERGLTTYCGLLSFAHPAGSVGLLAGSDGLLHLYYDDAEDGVLTVVQCDAETTRAVFVVAWQSSVAEPTAEAGRLQLMSARAGTFMNDCEITVRPTEDPDLCDLVIDDQQAGDDVRGRRETWHGVPRDASVFAEVLGGASTGSLDDPGLRTGKRHFYDNRGRYHTARLALGAPSADAHIVLASRVPNLQLAATAVSDLRGDTCTLLLELDVPAWDETRIAWRLMPANGAAALTVVGGIAPDYDYAAHDGEPRLHALPAVDGTGTARDLWLLTRGDVTSLVVGVTDGVAPELCTVTIELQVGTAPRVAIVPDISRTRSAVAEALSATDVGLEDVLLVLVDDLTVAGDEFDARIANRELSVLAPDDRKAWSTVLAAFSDDELDPQARLIEQSLAPARRRQGSSLSVGGLVEPLTGPSTMIRCLPADRPTNGGVALVQDVPEGEAAKRVTSAVNGGWLTRSPDQAISLRPATGVAWTALPGAINELPVAEDVTAEVWCRPVAGTGDAGGISRVLTYNHVGDPAHPDEPIEFALGLARVPSLKTTSETTIVGPSLAVGHDFSVQIWICPDASSQDVVLSLQTGTGSDWVFVVALDAAQHVAVRYPSGGQTALRSAAALPAGQWSQLTVTASAAGGGKSDVKLFVDGAEVAQAQVGSPPKPADRRHVLRVGNPGGAPMAANGVLLWVRALSADEVARSFQVAVSDRDRGLEVALNLTEGVGGTVANSAARGSGESYPISGSARWLKSGVYNRPVAAHGDHVLRAGRRAGLILAHPDDDAGGGWSHVALSYRSGYGLRVDGDDYADCGNDASLDLDSDLTIEAWVTLSGARVRQTIVSKPGNYELSVDADGFPELTLWTSRGVEAFRPGDYPLQPGVPAYVCAVASAGPLADPDDEDEEQQRRYRFFRQVTVDGRYSSFSSKDEHLKESVSLSTSTARLNLARNSEGRAYLRGELSNVRIWSRALARDDIADRLHGRHTGEDGLVSAWRFTEQQGKVAYDDNRINDARLSNNHLWCLYRRAGQLELVVNGVAQADAEYLNRASLGGYGPPQFRVGSPDGAADAEQAYEGELNDLRIWKVARTGEQIHADMYRELTGGETGLAGYWPLNTGSGLKAFDATGHGNDGEFFPGDAPPTWLASTAPISNEGREVYNALGGVRTAFQRRVAGPPHAVDYADLHRDAYGNLLGVMKRCYAAVTPSGVALLPGFKVGDLDTIYAGQVQTSPSLVGFIEGGPPIPSENQTNPWWADDNYRNTYAETAKTRLLQAQSTLRLFSGGEVTAGTASLAGRLGLLFSAELGMGVDVGPVSLDRQLFTAEARAGVSAELRSARSAARELGFGFGAATTTTDEISVGGTWEPAEDVLNTDVGRRYVPSNVGYAVVKSLTADMYLLALQGSRVVVKTALVPDPDIPEDVNIIDFPINPAYVKNGTLDGMVGFTPDPSYPRANLERGSYFKPLQAYSLKRAIERQDKRLESYYRQFDTVNHSRGSALEVLRSAPGSVVSIVAPSHARELAAAGQSSSDAFASFRDETLAKEPSYDWQQRLAKRNAVNTYVWTAAGGLHTEQCELVDSYSESYAGIGSWEVGGTVSAELSYCGVAGVYGAFDALLASTLERSSVKRKESETSFGVDVEFLPDRYLKQPLVVEDAPAGYSEDDAPGKVAGYRFMSFFLAPSTSNFDAFWTEVVDQNWLQSSADPAAAALLTATVQSNGAWRILHRVTYVSRVPPRLQTATADTVAPAVLTPANLADNAVLTRTITQRLLPEAPTPAEIGAVVTQVLGPDGPLSADLTWWRRFLEEAADRSMVAHRTLAALRTDLLTYMVQFYALSTADAQAVLRYG